MDIADFFHFQAAFHTDSVIDASADEKDVFGVNLLGVKPLKTFFVLDDFSDFFRNGLQFFDIIAVLFFTDVAANVYDTLKLPEKSVKNP